MKKWMILFSILLFISCEKGNKNVPTTKVSLPANDTVVANSPDTIVAKKYSNKRFRNVTVEKVAADKFRIRGEGQIFEANFNWIVEDGHGELKSGFTQTSAGAPAWGQFDFSIEVAKARENSTLNLVLCEISAEDGSRQHELSIPLP